MKPLLFWILIALPLLASAADELDSRAAGRDLASYSGPKCLLSVADFAVEIPGAPREVGDGLREMLQTALFQSNHYIVVDRLDTSGISAEQLLSDSFMADADAILLTGQMDPAEVLVYGTLVDLTSSGAGLRVKMPWMPFNAGGGYASTKVIVNLRAVDTASGRVLAASTIESSASAGRGSAGATFTGIDMPVELDMFRNTPIELCLRDAIYRAVIDITQTIPAEYYRH